jgi:hypothetical protein
MELQITVSKEFKSGQECLLQKLYNYLSQPISLERDERISGAVGWLLLFSFIVAYDAYAIKGKKIETLTRFFWRKTDNGINKTIPLLLWFALTAHLVLEKDIRRKAFSTKSS